MIRPKDIPLHDLKTSYLKNAMKNRPAGAPATLTEAETAFLAAEVRETPEGLAALLAGVHHGLCVAYQYRVCQGVGSIQVFGAKDNAVEARIKFHTAAKQLFMQAEIAGRMVQRGLRVTEVKLRDNLVLHREQGELLLSFGSELQPFP